jgi:redox-sensitive bicupin YhaK (pirin superfamily)
MEPGARWTIPPAASGETIRTLYVFDGTGVEIDGQAVGASTGAVVVADRPAPLHAGDSEVDILVLQGRPIGEPVARYGPFVMNDQAEIQQAFADYQRTGFGGWPWPTDDPVHGDDPDRFARHADGRVEREAVSSA